MEYELGKKLDIIEQKLDYLILKLAPPNQEPNQNE